MERIEAQDTDSRELAELVLSWIIHAKDNKFEERLQQNPLYDYAARNWGHHARAASMEVEQLVVNLLKSEAKVSSCSQATCCSTGGSCPLGWFCCGDSSCAPNGGQCCDDGGYCRISILFISPPPMLKLSYRQTWKHLRKTPRLRPRPMLHRFQMHRVRLRRHDHSVQERRRQHAHRRSRHNKGPKHVNGARGIALVLLLTQLVYCSTFNKNKLICWNIYSQYPV